MAKPTNRQELIDYCLRQLGAPVLEINVAEDQVDDIVDDCIQYFQERHFDGVTQTFLKYQVTQEDIDRGKASKGTGTGVESTSVTANVGTATTFTYTETANYLPIPDHIIGVNQIMQFEGSSSLSAGMFNIKYQLFLNDVYYWGSTELLTYQMVRTYLADIDFLLSTKKNIRFNKRSNRLYLDIDWDTLKAGEFLIIDCYRALDPSKYEEIWNDSFLKKYITASIKKQWGQNLIKFQGVKLPGGLEFNGRQLYEDGLNDINALMDKMSSTYELPPLDMIG